MVTEPIFSTVGVSQKFYMIYTFYTAKINMKRKVVFSCLCCFPFMAALSATRLAIPPEGVAFGEIAAGEGASKSIELRNASPSPVTVSQVKGCCGADASLFLPC